MAENSNNGDSPPPAKDISFIIEKHDKFQAKKTLDKGLQNKNIWPAFQPIVDIYSGNIVSFEVLARWNDSYAGEIPPSVFIPCLENHDLIETFSDHLMSQACKMATNWPEHISLAFNISPLQLAAEKFCQRLEKIASDSCFPINRIELEITESLLFSDDYSAYALLHELDELGVKIGIDDFGTGHSSLARLEAFPFHKLKIDSRFVHNIDSDPAKRRIAAAVIGLGQSLGITTVAEGIETQTEATILRNFGCDLGQGWLYGKGEPYEKAQLRIRPGSAQSTPPNPKPLDASPFQQLHQINNIYSQAPVGLCFLDTEFRYVRTNARFADIHALTPLELKGKKIHDILDERQLKRALKTLTASIHSDKPFEENYKFLGRDIKIIHSRVLDSGGDFVGFSLFSIDMTEENIIKRQAIEERDYANSILDSLPNVFYHYDQNTRLRRWNKNLETVTGYSDSELFGFDPLNFVPSAEQENLSKAINSVIETGQGSIETDLLIKDGSTIPYLFTGIKFDYKGEKGFVGVGTDISERRAMEHSLQEKNTFLDCLISSASDGIFILSPAGTPIIHNKKLETLFPEFGSNFNHSTIIEVMSKKIKTPQNFVETMLSLLPDPDVISTEHIELIDGTSMIKYTEPLRDSAGNYHGRLWRFTDPSESK